MGDDLSDWEVPVVVAIAAMLLVCGILKAIVVQLLICYNDCFPEDDVVRPLASEMRLSEDEIDLSQPRSNDVDTPTGEVIFHELTSPDYEGQIVDGIMIHKDQTSQELQNTPSSMPQGFQANERQLKLGHADRSVHAGTRSATRKTNKRGATAAAAAAAAASLNARGHAFCGDAGMDAL
eukprot:SAG31_NODE_1111_length_9858_cov_33.709909_6_plen_179_part_00